MENASKALIIAGAILISILLISLGIAIYNQAKEAASTDQMDDFQVSSFNSKFTQYEGNNKSGSIVKSLLDEVAANNANTDRNRGITVVTLKGTGELNSSNKSDADFVVAITSSETNPTWSENFSTSAKYDISVAERSNGYVSKITVKKH